MTEAERDNINRLHAKREEGAVLSSATIAGKREVLPRLNTIYSLSEDLVKDGK
jgi:hypothetical protein